MDELKGSRREEDVSVLNSDKGSDSSLYVTMEDYNPEDDTLGSDMADWIAAEAKKDMERLKKDAQTTEVEQPKCDKFVFSPPKEVPRTTARSLAASSLFSHILPTFSFTDPSSPIEEKAREDETAPAAGLIREDVDGDHSKRTSQLYVFSPPHRPTIAKDLDDQDQFSDFHGWMREQKKRDERFRAQMDRQAISFSFTPAESVSRSPLKTNAKQRTASSDAAMDLGDAADGTPLSGGTGTAKAAASPGRCGVGTLETVKEVTAEISVTRGGERTVTRSSEKLYESTVVVQAQDVGACEEKAAMKSSMATEASPVSPRVKRTSGVGGRSADKSKDDASAEERKGKEPSEAGAGSATKESSPTKARRTSRRSASAAEDTQGEGTQAVSKETEEGAAVAASSKRTSRRGGDRSVSGVGAGSGESETHSKRVSGRAAASEAATEAQKALPVKRTSRRGGNVAVGETKEVKEVEISTSGTSKNRVSRKGGSQEEEPATVGDLDKPAIPAKRASRRGGSQEEEPATVGDLDKPAIPAKRTSRKGGSQTTEDLVHEEAAGKTDRETTPTRRTSRRGGKQADADETKEVATIEISTDGNSNKKVSEKGGSRMILEGTEASDEADVCRSQAANVDETEKAHDEEKPATPARRTSRRAGSRAVAADIAVSDATPTLRPSTRGGRTTAADENMEVAVASVTPVKRTSRRGGHPPEESKASEEIVPPASASAKRVSGRGGKREEDVAESQSVRRTSRRGGSPARGAEPVTGRRGGLRGSVDKAADVTDEKLQKKRSSRRGGEGVDENEEPPGWESDSEAVIMMNETVSKVIERRIEMNRSDNDSKLVSEIVAVVDVPEEQPAVKRRSGRLGDKASTAEKTPEKPGTPPGRRSTRTRSLSGQSTSSAGFDAIAEDAAEEEKEEEEASKTAAVHVTRKTPSRATKKRRVSEAPSIPAVIEERSEEASPVKPSESTPAKTQPSANEPPTSVPVTRSKSTSVSVNQSDGAFETPFPNIIFDDGEDDPDVPSGSKRSWHLAAECKPKRYLSHPKPKPRRLKRE